MPQPHNPNPFDFVPFQPASDGPQLKTAQRWLREHGNLLSGYFDLRVHALTPVHVASKQDSSQQRMANINDSDIIFERSHFARQQGQPAITGSTIRGMLRSFLETASNGWAGELTPYFLKKARERQLGFMSQDSREEIRKEGRIEDLIDTSLPVLMHEHYLTSDQHDGGIDVASFLFGHVIGDGFVRKGRVAVKNAPISTALSDFKLPDIRGKAIMGGPSPSALTWWYQVPAGIRKRWKSARGREFLAVDFLGKHWRGRKFYFHQNHQACLDWYKNSQNWPQANKLVPYPCECLPPGEETDIFRIRFEEVPEQLVALLFWCLQPGRKMRHKLGNGRPFGFGSMEFNIVEFNIVHGQTALPALQNPTSFNWTGAAMDQHGVMACLHQNSLQHLAKILYYDPAQRLSQIFTYPTFNDRQFQGPKGFLPMIQEKDLHDALSALSIRTSLRPRTAGTDSISQEHALQIARHIAEVLDKKPALHFEYYQQMATGYDEITSRTFQHALGE